MVPALIGGTRGRSYARALTRGYQPAIIVMGGSLRGAALVTALFVSDKRTSDHPSCCGRPTPAVPNPSEPRK